ncbi:MAG: FeoA domain-containing protein [Promethearchaeota archaeon]
MTRNGRKRKKWNRVDPVSHSREKIRNIEEDILRYMGEHHLTTIYRDFLANDLCTRDEAVLSVVLEQLLREGLVEVRGSTIELNPLGQKIARVLYRIHAKLETFYEQIPHVKESQGRRRRLRQGHRFAHLVEHALSEEDIEKMTHAIALEERGRPLPNFPLPSGMIVYLNFEEIEMASKLVSLGLFPGQRIEIISNEGNNYLLRVKGAKIAVDRQIAKSLLLVP